MQLQKWTSCEMVKQLLLYASVVNYCQLLVHYYQLLYSVKFCHRNISGPRQLSATARRKDNTNMHKYTECWKNMHLSYVFRRPCFWHFPLCKNVSFRKWWQVEQIAGRCAGCIKTIKYFKTCAQRFDVNNITLKFTMYLKNGPNNTFSFGHFHSFALMHQNLKTDA